MMMTVSSLQVKGLQVGLFIFTTCGLAVQQPLLVFHHGEVEDSHPRSASRSRPDPIPLLRPRAWVMFTHLSLQFLS